MTTKERPNLFAISTKELTQDAFITWLLRYGDEGCKQYDEQIHLCSQAFIGSLIKKQISNFNEPIKTVAVNRQWKHIDVTATINGKYLIAIEDKIGAQTGNQLPKYKKSVEDECKKENLKPVYIYLKTIVIPYQEIENVESQGYQYYSGKEFLDLLEKYKSDNDVFNEFKNNLKNIFEGINSYQILPIKEWRSYSWHGFYNYLETCIEKPNHWFYIANPQGGALRFEWLLYNFEFQKDDTTVRLLIGIENDKNMYIRFWLSGKKLDVHTKPLLVEWQKMIFEKANELGYAEIKRGSRSIVDGKGSGALAYIDGGDWLGKQDEKIDLKQVVKNIKKYETFVKEIQQTIKAQH